MRQDVVIIGGGVIGLSCAWRLAQAGMRVTLLERGAIGAGASGAALGALIPATATHHGPLQMLQRQSLRMFPDFVRELESASSLDVGYRRCGLLEVIAGESRLANARKEVEASQREWPPPDRDPDVAPMAVLSAEQASDIAPQVQFQEWGARCCRLSAQVDVLALLAALERACRAAGAELRCGTEVTALDIEGGKLRGLHCGDNYVEAAYALVAAGAWVGRLHHLLARSAPVRPAKGQALLLQNPFAASKTNSPLLKLKKAYLVTCGEHIMVGSTTEPEAGFDCRPTAAGIHALCTGAAAICPALADAGVIRTWAGLRPEPAGHHPYLGPIPGAAGLFVAAGHYKTGIGLAPMTADLMTRLLQGDAATKVQVDPFLPR